ncbi:hypothetical protein CIL05_10775 [Virgibacillus profundi]|uniref:Uncharacterized protein n=1 Tax=Virgibacillus profundi TaxID=2024555 RepID=A0A2A2IDZ2_9BACI|nr:hypothetical protein [Virgibacillus profundi]PAV29350.1 hypothetical protein CIL05_10775 [Virgibacillus profundi]PXY53518.1 hypothetical protein CIT14_10875 [Virgibacillus profundi]
MEQRIIDRMEGAASIFDQTDEALKAALITGLNFAVKNSIYKLISEEFPNNKKGKIEAFLSNINSNKDLPIEIVLISIWRSILKGISCDQVTLEQGKYLINWIFKRED